MLYRVLIVTFFFVAVSASASDARPSRSFSSPPECNVSMPCDFGSVQQRRISRASRISEQNHSQSPASSYRNAMASVDVQEAQGQIVSGRPAGCPRSFCGCGASLRVFGRIVPGLNLASNWLRFPRTAPSPGMVAARHGHVFVLEQHIAGDTWMAYDANSGGHATRVHARSLRGYTIVNPHA